MQNLLLFFLRYRLVFLFVFLEVISIGILVQKRSFHRSVFVNSAQAWVAKTIGVFGNTQNFFQLQESNERLLEENMKLRSLLQEVRGKLNQPLQDSVVDTVYRQQYQFVRAKVVQNSFNSRNNYLTLSAGKRNGIEVGDAVIGPEGIVGIVDAVTDHYTSVISLLHKESSISGKLKNEAYFGSVRWDGFNHRQAQLHDVPRQAGVVIGDTVVTNAYSKVFPEGIPIGVIKEVELKTNENFYTIELDLLTDFAALSYVYVVNNLFKEDLEMLEEAREDA